MEFPGKLGWAAEWLMAAPLMAGLWMMTGCGTPGAPQAPSLHLPGKVEDLTAVRAARTVTLHWTMPRKTTDHLLVQWPVVAVVCRSETVFAAPAAAVGASASAVAGRAIPDCERAGQLTLSEGTAGEFKDILPASLCAGAPRKLAYFVELRNKARRSAGVSNAALILAGAAPGAVTGLVAQVSASGVALHWDAAAEGQTAAVRLHRTLLSPAKNAAAKADGQKRLMKAPAEPVNRDLIVDAPAAGSKPGALDESVHFGMEYQYSAQRVVQVTVAGQMLELPGETSAAIRVDTADSFPPAVPAGLAAVFSGGEDGALSIDLSWSPGTEADLAGYRVYRAGLDGDWVRISPEELVAAPAFRDGHVQRGHTYRYAVSAVDALGHESKRSDEAAESVPDS